MSRQASCLWLRAEAPGDGAESGQGRPSLQVRQIGQICWKGISSLPQKLGRGGMLGPVAAPEAIP